MVDAHLLWFLKAPRPGYVKTRLGREIGTEAALAAYETMVNFLWMRLGAHYPSTVFFDPLDAEEEMRQWLGRDTVLTPQAEGDLGQRLRHAFSAHAGAVGGPALALGGDCPYLDRFYLDAAARALRHVDLVLGPAHDGGYTLIGLRQPCPALFATISWGGSAVLEQTLERARTSGISWKLLEPHEDVDDARAWERARRFLKKAAG